jgi:hypothetical protein
MQLQYAATLVLYTELTVAYKYTHDGITQALLKKAHLQYRSTAAQLAAHAVVHMQQVVSVSLCVLEHVCWQWSLPPVT